MCTLKGVAHAAEAGVSPPGYYPVPSSEGLPGCEATLRLRNPLAAGADAVLTRGSRVHAMPLLRRLWPAFDGSTAQGV